LPQALSVRAKHSFDLEAPEEAISRLCHLCNQQIPSFDRLSPSVPVAERPLGNLFPECVQLVKALPHLLVLKEPTKCRVYDFSRDMAAIALKCHWRRFWLRQSAIHEGH
jgi:hypothetical protein